MEMINQKYSLKVTKQNVEGKNEVEINQYIDYKRNWEP
jgi:hypothetical protein